VLAIQIAPGTQEFTMANVDFSKFIAGLDLTKGADELMKMLAQYKVPGVNMDALVASQRENLEALATANRAAFEGMKAVAEWQVKILNETMKEISNTAGELAKAGSPQDVVGKQADLAKQALQAAVTNMRDLAEIVNKAHQEATGAITERVTESLDEIKDVLKIKQEPPVS
jgi:phasin family protein